MKIRLIDICTYWINTLFMYKIYKVVFLTWLQEQVQLYQQPKELPQKFQCGHPCTHYLCQLLPKRIQTMDKLDMQCCVALKWDLRNWATIFSYLQRRDCQYGYSSVIQISFKSILAKFLNFFRVKAFCKKACCEWDSIWGLLGGSPVSLPLYQHNMLENWD